MKKIVALLLLLTLCCGLCACDVDKYVPKTREFYVYVEEAFSEA